MPVSVELKYEYFNTWAGRVKIVELVSQFLVLGGFQLLDLIIPELKSHVIPYEFKCSHWWKIHL